VRLHPDLVKQQEEEAVASLSRVVARQWVFAGAVARNRNLRCRLLGV
jgi:hypothetical protein